MRITFVSTAGVPYHARTLLERPLGGTETGAIHLAHELHLLGHEVTCYTQLANPPLTAPLYLPLSSLHEARECDVVISIRTWEPLLIPFPAKVRVLWSGDSYDQLFTVGIGDKRIAQAINLLCTVSNWHAQTLGDASGFPDSKIYNLGNGVDLSQFTGHEPRTRKRLIYSSTPYRGLVHLPEIFSQIRQKHHDAELHIYSGFAVYRSHNEQHELEKEFAPLFESLKKTPGCIVFGNVQQRALARAFMQASVLAYPNTFEETSCITALEAQAAGCVAVTSARGALPETVGDAGILIEGAPGTAAYTTSFINAVDELFTNDARFNALQQAGFAQSKLRSWSTIASRFIQQIEQLLMQNE
jgi:glycosyltransferase involved in cell wall biosynthesis